MSKTDEPVSGPEMAARLATEKARFDRSGLLLLGTFGTTEAPGALLRLPDGAIRRVTPGDTVEGAQVMSISNGKLVLVDGDTARTLHLPT